MDEKIAELISSLGEDGVTAFYVYIISERLEFVFFMSLVVWGVRSVWPYVKKEMFDDN